MSMQVSFPGGVAVKADFKGFEILTDQPEANGGSNTAPSPFALFLASLGTCAGFFALRFCQQRDLPTEGMSLSLETTPGSGKKKLDSVKIVLHLPDDFPEKYRPAVIRAMDQCAVKQVLHDPPEFEVVTD